MKIKKRFRFLGDWLKALDETIGNHSGRLCDFDLAIGAINRRIDEWSTVQRAGEDALAARVDAQARTILDLEKQIAGLRDRLDAQQSALQFEFARIDKAVFPSSDMVPVGDVVDKPKTVRQFLTGYIGKNKSGDGYSLINLCAYQHRPANAKGIWVDFPVED